MMGTTAPKNEPTNMTNILDMRRPILPL
jgi:hypothetical protein